MIFKRNKFYICNDDNIFLLINMLNGYNLLYMSCSIFFYTTDLVSCCTLIINFVSEYFKPYIFIATK